jgi:hypothetical protein
MRMSNWLPSVGSLALLSALTDFVPDEFINSRWPLPRRSGRRFHFSAAQLWRVHLLAALSGGQSFNAVRRLLIDQRAWRRFAHLPNERAVPDTRMLHQFRSRVGVSGWRWINDYLVQQVLEVAPLRDQTVGLIDATDLPARTRDKKKKVEFGRRAEPHWVHAL